MAKFRKDKRTAMIGDLVTGAGSLIILVVITLIVVSTLLGANLLRATASTSTATETSAWINSTGYTLTGFSTSNRAYAITSIANVTGPTLLSGNYTFDSTTGTITNATPTTWDNVNVTYTYIAPTNYETTTDALSGNFTTGISNVSTKLPTIFLIAAVVLLFGVLVVLVVQAKRSGLMGSGGGSL